MLPRPLRTLAFWLARWWRIAVRGRIRRRSVFQEILRLTLQTAANGFQCEEAHPLDLAAFQ